MNPKRDENGNINAEFAENPQNRPTDGLIRKQDAIDALATYIYNVYKIVVGKRMPTDKCRQAAESVLGELPTVQPERIKGHWIEITLRNHTYKCSVCGRLLVNITDGKNNVAKNYPYCHCGADMRGEQDE